MSECICLQTPPLRDRFCDLTDSTGPAYEVKLRRLVAPTEGSLRKDGAHRAASVCVGILCGIVG